MSAPKRLDVVEQLASQYPQEFAEAHRFELGDRAWAFIRRLAWELHQLDTNFGLNGKRGNTSDPSADAISYRGGPAGGVWVIDVIAGAGGASPEPAWHDVTQATLDAGTIGAWIQPEPVDGGSEPPNPDPAPSNVRALVEAVAARFHPSDPQYVHRVAYASFLQDSSIGQKRASADRPISISDIGIQERGGLRAVRIMNDSQRTWRDFGIVPGVWVQPAPLDIGEQEPPADQPPPPADPLPPGSLEARVAEIEAQVRSLHGNQETTATELAALKSTLRSV